MNIKDQEKMYSSVSNKQVNKCITEMYLPQKKKKNKYNVYIYF